MSNNGIFQTIEYPKMDLPKPEVHGGHPFVNPVSHEKLLNYVVSRLYRSREVRDAKLNRYAQIDKDFAGWMRLTEEDRRRKSQKESTGEAQAININLPLTFVQIDDMMTYFAQTFSPTRGMFFHSGKPDESQSAAQIVTLMNNHAIYDGYYRNVLKTCLNVLKYNEGGFYGFWAVDIGPKILSDPATQENRIEDGEVWSGNRLECLDPYNTFYDPSVDPTDCYKHGEWVGRAMLKSHFYLQKKALEGVYFNLNEVLDTCDDNTECKFYRSPPAEAHMNLDESTASGPTNWKQVLSSTPDYMAKNGYEVVECIIRLNPYDLNLVPRNSANRQNRNRYELWMITVVNAKYVIGAQQLNNMHGYLPYFVGRVNDDSMGGAQKSVAEIITPLSDFASFLLNAHVAANRKNIFGFTVYDPLMVDLNAVPAGEVAARVPVKAAAYGKDIRSFIWEHNQRLDTTQTMSDLEKVMGILNQFFPASAGPSQIASIDRAVDSQVAAVQQGVNRRSQKSARLLDDLLFRPMRFCFYYNIIQFQKDNVETTDFRGRIVTINLQQLRQTDLPFIIGQGLKAIDRQAAASALQQVIFAIIQNPAVAQQVDLLGMIDYWTSMIDIDIDMTQFHIQQQQPEVGPDGQPIQGEGTGVDAAQPMTDPTQVGRPLDRGVRI